MIVLNGWQRLWVLVSASYLLGVLAIAFSSLPTESDVSSAEILRQVSDQSLLLMHNASKEQQWNPVTEDGISIPIPVGLDQAAVQTFKADYKNAVKVAVHKKRAEYFAQALVWWLAPSALLYALGLGIAWVRRGFKRGI